MAKTRSSEDALSRERIVDVATEILDTAGEDGLTFRILAARLATGPGALYWHVANKGELLAAATNAVVAGAMAAIPVSDTPHAALHGIALAVFDAIDAHPWVGAQLSRAPWEIAMLQIFERIGQQVQALGSRGPSQFTAASALLGYIVGVSIQNSASARLLDPSINRSDFLEWVSAQWKALDANEYPFTRNVVAAQLPDHDDRVEFLAGLDLILAGIAASS